MTGIPSIRNRYSGLMVAAAVYVSWATTWPVGKLAMSQWTPLGLTTTRHLVGGVVLLSLAAAYSAWPRPPRRNEIVIGVLQCGVYFYCSYRALELGTAAITAVIAGAYPVLVALLSPRDEQRRLFRILSLVLMVLGVGLVAFGGAADFKAIAGQSTEVLGWAAAAAIAMALATRVPRPAGSVSEVVRSMAIAMLCGAIATGALAIVLGDPWLRGAPGWKDIGTLAWLSLVGSAAVFVGLEWLLRRYKPWRVSMGYAAVPGMAAAMSMIWLGERISEWVVVGLLLTLGALSLTELGSRHPPIIESAR